MAEEPPPESVHSVDLDNALGALNLPPAPSKDLEEEEDNDEASQGTYGDDLSSLADEELPPYACSYCGIHNPTSCVLCVDTNKWFCTDTTGTKPTSHIVSHLVSTKSTRIQLHEDSALSDSPITCYNCGTRNIFTLGFCPATSSQTVVLLCRSCVDLKEMKDLQWR